jgi:predicted dehydrogenase
VTASTDRPRVAVFGSGAIIASHVTALRAVGADVVALASRARSERVDALAASLGISSVFGSAHELAAADGWDAAVVATSVEATVDVTAALAPAGRPLLVEKPIGLRAGDLDPLAGFADRIVVGYNRRFYASVEHARCFVAERGPVIVNAVVPETIRAADPPSTRLRPFFANSVHVLDLLRSVLPDLRVVRAEQVRAHGEITALGGVLVSGRGDLVLLTANWNAPDNFRITFAADAEQYELRPLEVGQRYQGMTVLPVDLDAGRRTKEYHPTPAGDRIVDEPGSKPGFDGQARAFLRFAGGGDAGPAARLPDAVAVLQLAEELVGIDEVPERAR